MSGNVENGDDRNISIFISVDDVHSDIILPIHNHIKDWTTVIPLDQIISKDTSYNYITFG